MDPLPNKAPIPDFGVELLRALVESAPDALVVVDRDGKMILVNAQAERMFGYQREELLGKAVEMLVPEGARKMHPQHRAAFASHPAPRRIGEGLQLSGRRKDGTEFSAEISLSPLHTAQGLIVSGAIRDVTRRRAMEEALRASERRFREVVRRTDEAEQATRRGSWEWDVDSNRAIWSKGMYALFGVDPATFVNTNENFLAMVHPEDRGRMQHAMGQALADPGPFLQEYRLIRPDGGVRHIRGEGNVVADPGGQARLMYGFVQDVTARREAQKALEESREQFSAFFQQSVSPMLITRLADGKIIQANQAFARLTGRDLGEVVGRTAQEIGLVHDVGMESRAIREVQAKGHVTDWEFRVLAADGSERTVVAAVSAIQLGGEACLASSGLDITERKRMEQALRENQERLTHLNEFKTNFMNMAAHDLNNALTPLRLTVRLLKGAADEGRLGDLTQSAAILHRSSERLAAFLADLLDAARLESGALRLKSTSMDLKQTLETVVEDAQQQAADANVRVVARVPSRLRVVADPYRIEQVATNLLSNAIKFTPSGGRVEIDVQAMGDLVRIEVHDTGIGLRPEDVHRLFQPFVQVGGPVQGRHTGTGLGLFISKGIVEAHGGRISVASPGPGHGTTFTVIIPGRGAAHAADA